MLDQRAVVAFDRSRHDGLVTIESGSPDDVTEYLFSAGLDAPSTIVLTDVSPFVEELVRNQARADATIEIRNEIGLDQYEALSAELTGGVGFESTVVEPVRTTSQS